MPQVDTSELALLQRQCELAHIAHPMAAMALALWPTRNPDMKLPDIPPFYRDDGHIINEYDHSLGYVLIYFYGSIDALTLYKQLATAACVAMPEKRNAENWAEWLFEQRQSYGRPLQLETDKPRFIPLRENPFLASALAIQSLRELPIIDSEMLRRRSLDALRGKFERAAERSPKASHYIVICDADPTKHEHGEYVFKTLDGRWWRCRADGVNMGEFGGLCREAAHICQDHPRITLMPKPSGVLGHDDAWMMFVHRLAWREPPGSALRAFTEWEGGSEVSSATAREEPNRLFSELRPNLYTACAMAIDVILAMPAESGNGDFAGLKGSSGSADASPAVAASQQSGWPDGEWRTAAWFRDATSDLILPDAMRQAGKRGLIQCHQLNKRGDWRYEASSVVRNWPEHRGLIERKIKADKGEPERTPADK